MINKSDEAKFLRLVQYIDGQEHLNFLMDRDKAIVGSGAGCDFIIEDNFTSHYHALFQVEEDGLSVQDLGSKNGLYVNGERLTQGFVLPGDVLEIADKKFLLEEVFMEKMPFTVLDDKISKFVKDSLKDLPPIPPKEGLEVIDGEYCDIVFDQEDYTPSNIHTLSDFQYEKEYIDYDESNHDKSHDILIGKSGESLEVTITSMGVVLAMDYVSIKNKEIFLTGKISSGNRVNCPLLSHDESVKLASINGKNLHFNELEGFQSARLNEFQIFTKGTVQIFARVSNHPPTLKMGPLFETDKNFYKQSGSVFGAMLSIMLILLFVKLPEPPKPEEKRVVIFKQAVLKGPEVTDKTSEEVSKVDQDQGVQKQDISEKQPKMAQAKAQVQKQEKKQNKPTPQKVAESKPAAKAEAKPVEKKFEFKVTKGLTKFLNKKVDIKFDSSSESSDSPSRSVAATMPSQASASSANNFKTNLSNGNANLGSNSVGSDSASEGLKGMASKKGINTAYQAPKTIVLGSIDPELLRKILREYLPQFHYCYQNELDKKQDLIKGIVDLKFRINGNGKVSNIDIISKGAKFSNKGVDCMAQVLHMIDFPMPKGGGIVDVKQPLNFQSERSRI